MIISSQINSVNHRQPKPFNQVAFAGKKIPASLPVDSFQGEIQERLGQYVNRYNYSLKKPLQWRMKRAFDYTAASAGIVVTSPVMLATAVAIKLESKGPVLFKQTRIGQGGKPFTVYKFRSMVVHSTKNQDNDRVVNDSRITKVGKFIRKYSLDEIPQLFNVLKGDISLVGPRPLAVGFHQRLLEEEPNAVKRYATIPGAMLRYPRNKVEITSGQRVKTESGYLENWNIGKDIKHFFGTLKDVIMGNNF